MYAYCCTCLALVYIHVHTPRCILDLHYTFFLLYIVHLFQNSQRFKTIKNLFRFLRHWINYIDIQRTVEIFTKKSIAMDCKEPVMLQCHSCCATAPKLAPQEQLLLTNVWSTKTSLIRMWSRTKKQKVVIFTLPNRVVFRISILMIFIYFVEVDWFAWSVPANDYT